MLEIVYYQNPETKEIPVKNEIKKINKASHKTRIYANIIYTAKNGGKADGHISKTIRGGKLLEIRIKISKNLYRIIYCVLKKEKMVLLYMFAKREGEPTLQKHINLAENNLLIYLQKYE